ncbi:MAG: hypothetical protein PHS02_02105 [Candidatus ainarchaeum sp.]|nr:hypothetical protein [Candidatus ainarchaeum sp.]
MEPESVILRNARKDLEWFGEHYTELVTKYDEQFIAIKNAQPIASASNMEDLIAYLNKSGIDPVTTLIKYVTRAYTIL